MSDDQVPPGMITTFQIGLLLGYTGERARVIASANVWLSRNPGIVSSGREPGRAGQNYYPAEAIRAAIDSAPGKGSPGQPRTDRRKTRPESESTE